VLQRPDHVKATHQTLLLNRNLWRRIRLRSLLQANVDYRQIPMGDEDLEPPLLLSLEGFLIRKDLLLHPLLVSRVSGRGSVRCTL
jgi:hypothetical protein